MFFRLFCLLSAVCLLFANAAFAQEIQVLKISAEDERATVKTADGKIKMIKVGEIIEKEEFRVQSAEAEIQSSKLKGKSSGLRVTEISDGRIVFEEKTKKGIETVIIRVENGKQKIERISKVPEGGPITYGRGGK